MFLTPRSDLPCTGAFTAPTQTDREFHRIDKTYASTAVWNALARGILTRDDADLINEFVTELQASHGITLSRVNKIISHLINWRLYFGSYRTATIGDIFSAIATIKEAESQRGRPFKQNTLHDSSCFSNGSTFGSSRTDTQTSRRQRSGSSGRHG